MEKQAYTTALLAVFEEHADPARAESMRAYLKDQFAFFGLAAPKRRALQKPFLTKALRPKKDALAGVAVELWEDKHREAQYMALDLLVKCKNQAGKDSVFLYESLITEKSWWDTVDLLASKLVGDLFLRFPELADEHAEAWVSSKNMWLRRTALLYQLKYKDKTDFERLGHYIRLNAASKEFFIQKAIGWALREHSKQAPGQVKSFLANNELPKRSLREASKYLS